MDTSEFISKVANNEPMNAAEIVDQILNNKAMDAINLYKQDVASAIFTGTEQE